jgi:hypothetical protein
MEFVGVVPFAHRPTDEIGEVFGVLAERDNVGCRFVMQTSQGKEFLF